LLNQNLKKMQITGKIRNKSTAHSLLLKPKVGDVVSFEGRYYSNISGRNSAVSDSSNWFPLSAGSDPVIVDKTALNITGTDPDFSISLLNDGIPAFPASLSVYIDLEGDDNYLKVDPVIYDPLTKVLSGMNSPADFADQKIKVVAI